MLHRLRCVLPRLLSWKAWLLIGLLPGCAILASFDLNSRFGEPVVQRRNVDTSIPELSSIVSQYQQAQDVLESRCVVCHGCYDAPCQLKLTSAEGIDRGASKSKVYHGTRLLPAEPSRLFVDATTTDAWRKKDFFPVLNERDQSTAANFYSGVMWQLLDQKQRNPLPANAILPESLTLGLDREQQCPTAEEYAGFAQQYPLWGMPYALPALTGTEQQTLTDWLASGAPMPEPKSLSNFWLTKVAQWEQFLNQDSLKGQLVSRYIYEHLFLAHLYFDEAAEKMGVSSPYFRLVRSYTPPGEAIDVIPTRRPYDDPGTADFYYRLQLDHAIPVAKTRMPYALNHQRQSNWQQWFFNNDYRVTELPSYQASIASNPFVAFEQLPVKSRYRFMLAEAEYTISGFIKGPVCRGQVALNVIRDRFWVVFLDPELTDPNSSAKFLADNSDHLVLPAEAENTLNPLGKWRHYSKQHREYVTARYEYASDLLESSSLQLTTDLIWDGDGDNRNAALTVFRHFDSATVVKGLVGQDPQTAWVVSYPILERIHYLLVAGFDVYGNVSHQLLTRLYMDFLRMESEFYFLALLPDAEQQKLWQNWYRGAKPEILDFVSTQGESFQHQTEMAFLTDNPQHELYEALKQRLAGVVDHAFDRNFDPLRNQIDQQPWLDQIEQLNYPAITLLPQMIVLSVQLPSGDMSLYTVLRNNAHSNISSLLDEESNRLPKEDDLTVVPGILGSYPRAFWHVSAEQLPAMVKQLGGMNSEDDYQDFMQRFGIRRTHPDFWAHSDKVHQLYAKQDPIGFGMLDYNRLENR